MIGRLVIRADADSFMGTGHVMRCLALAEAWRDRGGEVLFVGRIEPEPLRQRIECEGAGVIELAERHPDPADLAAMRCLAGEQLNRYGTLGWMVLDGYHFDCGYQQAIRDTGWQLLVIDDLGLLAEYHCEALLNQNLYAPSLAYQCSPGAVMLLGSRYALLRREFRHCDAKHFLPETVQRLLVTMGGADEHNVTAKVLSALAISGTVNLEVKAVVGAANPHAHELADLAVGLPFRCELIRDVSDMAALMRWADAAVTAAGTTTYELACVGTPFVALVTADNQEANANQLGRQGVAVALGRHDAMAMDVLANRLREFLCDGVQRLDQAARGRELVDGRGVGRVVSTLLAKGVQLHPAGWTDGDLLLRWANDPESRKNSFHSKTISQEEHFQWLAAKLADPNCRLWLASLPGFPQAGMVRFDLEQGRAEISVNLAPELRGQGMGSVLIRAACAKLFREDLTVESIIALVKSENHASLAAFAAANFVVQGKTEHLGIPTLPLGLERNRHG